MPRRPVVSRTVLFHRYSVLVVDTETGVSSVMPYDFYYKQPNDAAVINHINRQLTGPHAVKVKGYEVVSKRYEMPIEEFIFSATEVD